MLSLLLVIYMQFHKITTMKRLFYQAIILILVAQGCASSDAQKSSKKAEEYKKITALIEGGKYKFHVKSASPTGARTVQTSSGYAMSVNEGVFKAYLPYFGRAYQASYGGDGGVEFDGEAEELEITKIEKKRLISVEFKIRSEFDLYTVHLEAGSGGFGTLYITSQKRQAISYSGTISALKTP